MAFLDYAGLQRYHNTLLDATLTSNKKAAPAGKVGELSDDISAKPDIDLGITGASVGNYAKVKTVDANGKPTAWEYGSGGGGGGGGTSDYTDLTNKPQINSVTLTGNKTTTQLGLAADDVVIASDTEPVSDTNMLWLDDGSGETKEIAEMSDITGLFPNTGVDLEFVPDSSYFAQGNIDSTTGAFDETSTTRISTGFIPLSNITVLSVVMDDEDYQNRVCFYDYKQTFIPTTEQQSWQNNKVYPIPTGAKFYRICLREVNNSTITYNTETGCRLILKTMFEMKKRTQLYGKTISILGDSLSTFAGTDNYATSSVQATADGTYTYAGNKCRYPQLNLLVDVEETYWMKLVRHFGMTLLVNDSWAGTRVSGTSESAITNMTRIGHLDDAGTPDYILVNAGTNDIGNEVTIGTFDTTSPTTLTQAEILELDTTTFADAFRALLIRLQYFYPDSVVIVLLPNYTSSYYRPDEADDYNEIIKEACDYFGVRWIDARTSGITMFNKSKYLPDGIHYNSAGMNLLYENIKNQLEMYFAG